MTTVTREMILAVSDGQWMSKARLEGTEKLAREFLLPRGSGSIVWTFYEAPAALQSLCSFNGGDEDWLVLRRAPFESLPRWIDMEPDYDVYLLDEVTIYVTSHS